MTFAEFQALAASYTMIPLTRTVAADTLTPVSAYLRARRGTTASFLFESVEGGERSARYSFIGRNPQMLLRSEQMHTTVLEGGAERRLDGNLLDVLGEQISRHRAPKLPSLPRFTGGLVGYIGYDAVRAIEKIPWSSPSELPESIMGLFCEIIVFDHLKHDLTLIVNAVITPSTDLAKSFEAAVRTLDETERLLFDDAGPAKTFHSSVEALAAETSEAEFMESVVKARGLIAQGEVFQVVLSQRFSASFTGDLFNVYRALRRINPSPYLYFLDFREVCVIGSSPEMLVRVEDGLAEVVPIAGTRPRAGEQDLVLERELLADDKERAEHVMLVDLGRNDLGKVCECGSVRIEELMTVVRYSHVMHLASRVSGRILPGTSSIDVLKAVFPAGTVSGAPKIRAMEIIDELERSSRGVYAGAVGYFDFSGNVDLCIAIRTLVAHRGRLFLQAGAGIVADSDPRREYLETLSKAKVLVEALRMAEGEMR